MFINLKRLKAPEIRKLAKTYNKLNSIPHPSTLKKADLIKYLKEHLETNKKGAVFISHPKLQKSIKEAIDRIKKEDEEARQNLEKTIQDIEKEIRPKIKAREEADKTISYRDTLTKEQRDEQDRRMKHLIETGELLIEPQKPSKRSKKDIEKEKAIVKQLEEERQKEREARSKRNQEIMKKVREELKAKEDKIKQKPKKPTKKKVKEEVKEEEDEETPEEKEMRLYFATIKDPKQRLKEVREYLIKQRDNIRKKVEAKEGR